MDDTNRSINSRVWTKPVKDTNECLFLDSTYQLLRTLAISRDELENWQSRGWISFAMGSREEISSPLCSEIEFIRNLVRSGLSFSQIDEMLRSLEAPYRFDPERVAFHPRHGWVSPKIPCGKPEDDEASDRDRKDKMRSIQQMKSLRQQLRLLMDEILSLV